MCSLTFISQSEYKSGNSEVVVGCIHRPACPSGFARISTEIGWQYGSTHISQNTDTASRKCGNREFVASEADHSALMGSYRSLTFAYFKPFRRHKQNKVVRV